ncbi:alpha/beta fold hydrolase [Leifsonia shinshuensis]|uniref:alpha/beta fold hydrolase n=1 Tax=Leifsonia shinshuensis TaxID=150026 RepID=UPI0016274A0C|nr:alpha/beta hydrolase [Leifsonia shinshuensis]
MSFEPIPMVLVHGWAGSAESWRPVLDALKDRWDAPVVAARLPGSPGEQSGRRPTIADAVESVAELIEELRSPVIVVGHSMGAQVTLRLQALVPEKLGGEIVIDPAYAAEDHQLMPMIEWAAQINQAGPSALAEFFAESFGPALSGPDRERILNDLSATPASVISSYLRSEYVDADAVGLWTQTFRAAKRRTRPVLAFHSTLERALQERALPAPAGSDIRVWDGAGHFLHLEDPIRFASDSARWAEITVMSALTASLMKEPK